MSKNTEPFHNNNTVKRMLNDGMSVEEIDYLLSFGELGNDLIQFHSFDSKNYKLVLDPNYVIKEGDIIACLGENWQPVRKYTVGIKNQSWFRVATPKSNELAEIEDFDNIEMKVREEYKRIAYERAFHATPEEIGKAALELAQRKRQIKNNTSLTDCKNGV